jgi:hypothetical protein
VSIGRDCAVGGCEFAKDAIAERREEEDEASFGRDAAGGELIAEEGEEG